MTMRGIREMDLPKPRARKGEVCLRVELCGICRTDAKILREGHRDLLLPRVLGHEVCVIDDSTQKRYAVWPGETCGRCRECQSGMENLCPQMRILGFHRDGGFAEWMTAPRRSLLPAPPKLPSDLVCLAEPLACAINALEQTQVKTGWRVLIHGGGVVGLLMGMAAKEKGATPCVIEKRPAKRKMAAGIAESLELEIDEKIPGSRFDAAINATSDVKAFKEGLGALRNGGMYGFFSGLASDPDLSRQELNEIHYRQLRLAGSYGCTRRQMTQALSMLQRNISAAGHLIFRRIIFHEIVPYLPVVESGEFFRVLARPAQKD